MKDKVKVFQEHYTNLLGHIFEYEYEEIIDFKQTIEQENKLQIKEQSQET